MTRWHVRLALAALLPALWTASTGLFLVFSAESRTGSHELVAAIKGMPESELAAHRALVWRDGRAVAEPLQGRALTWHDRVLRWHRGAWSKWARWASSAFALLFLLVLVSGMARWSPRKRGLHARLAPVLSLPVAVAFATGMVWNVAAELRALEDTRVRQQHLEGAAAAVITAVNAYGRAAPTGVYATAKGLLVEFEDSGRVYVRSGEPARVLAPWTAAGWLETLYSWHAWSWFAAAAGAGTLLMLFSGGRKLCRRRRGAGR